MGMSDRAGEYAVYRIDESGREAFVNQYPTREEAARAAENAKDAGGEPHVIKRVDIKFMEDDEGGAVDHVEAGWVLREIVGTLVEAYEETTDDVEAETVLNVARKFAVATDVIAELRANGWEV